MAAFCMIVAAVRKMLSLESRAAMASFAAAPMNWVRVSWSAKSLSKVKGIASMLNFSTREIVPLEPVVLNGF